MCLCLSDECVHCETWEVMLAAVRHLSDKQKKSSFMTAVCTSSVRLKEVEGHLSTAVQGKGVYVWADGIRGWGWK